MLTWTATTRNSVIEKANAIKENHSLIVSIINKEIDVYGYKPLESPFFYVDNVESKIITEDKDLKIFNPLNNTCWASKTPCSYKTNLKISNFLWMKMILTK